VEQSAQGPRRLAVIPVMFILMLFILMVQLQSVAEARDRHAHAPLGLIGVTLGAAALAQALRVRCDAWSLRSLHDHSNSVVLIRQSVRTTSEGMTVAGNHRGHGAQTSSHPARAAAVLADSDRREVLGTEVRDDGGLYRNVLAVFCFLYAMWYRVRADATQT